MASTDEVRFTREMGLTFNEFVRTLPGAIAPLCFAIEGRRITISHPRGGIEITLGETGTRRIAAIALPSTRVEFRFSAMDEENRARFMEKFDLYFHRGGG